MNEDLPEHAAAAARWGYVAPTQVEEPEAPAEPRQFGFMGRFLLHLGLYGVIIAIALGLAAIGTWVVVGAVVVGLALWAAQEN